MKFPLDWIGDVCVSIESLGLDDRVAYLLFDMGWMARSVVEVVGSVAPFMNFLIIRNRGGLANQRI